MKTVSLTEWQERLRQSLWFVPGIATIVAFAAAKLLVALDRHIARRREAWFLFGGGPDSARELLSTIASSMMTFTGLVFSITILVLQLASSQFSPRVLRTFLEDRETKIAMGAFVGTFVFTMALLPDVRGDSEGVEAFVPALSVYAAFALVLLSVGVFIHYIDHMAHSVRAISVIKRVSAETRRSLERMYPESILESAEQRRAQSPAEAASRVIAHDGPAGVFTAVDEKELLRVATECAAIVALVPKPGDYVPLGAPLFRVWGWESSLDDEDLVATVLVGEERTLHQDPAFGFRQLVDVAERALSPGINDPSTAVQSLDEIHDLLRLLVQRRFPSAERVDEEGMLRLILPRPEFRDYVHLALDEIRQFGGGSIQVVRRMRVLIQDCLTVASESRRAPLEQQLMLLDAATRRHVPDEADRAFAREGAARDNGRSA